MIYESVIRAWQRKHRVPRTVAMHDIEKWTGQPADGVIDDVHDGGKDAPPDDWW